MHPACTSRIGRRSAAVPISDQFVLNLFFFFFFSIRVVRVKCTEHTVGTRVVNNITTVIYTSTPELTGAPGCSSKIRSLFSRWIFYRRKGFFFFFYMYYMGMRRIMFESRVVRVGGDYAAVHRRFEI